MIAIADYGISNIRSVTLALQDVTENRVIITSDHADLIKADKIVLPGVCSSRACMAGLRKNNLVETIKEEALVKKKPILGICVGMQVFSTVSYEHGKTPCLGIVEGEVVKVKTRKVPHMGWNKCRIVKNSQLFRHDEQFFYFANSFHFVPADEAVISLKTTLDAAIVAGIEQGNVFGCQFHPERSGPLGLEVLRRFAQI